MAESVTSGEVSVRRDRIVRDDDASTAADSADSRPLIRECPIGDGSLCSDPRMVTGRVRVRIER